MNEAAQKYEAVIGLEVHARLSTKSKLFCSDANSYGAAPNENVGVITLAHPGILPKTNKKAVEYAVMTGLACNCSINQKNYFARKHYFYPDLPKGFQTSQHTVPICGPGFVTIRTSAGERHVKLHHIHLEEDAGKSIHDMDEDYSYIDLNRAGTPLIEIVTEPDMHSAEEAGLFVTELRKLVRWINVCDGNMEEGSLRCDANVSIRLKDEIKLGTKVEVKNLNSIRNVRKAIEFEIDRMIGLLEKGEKIYQQTRSFDASNDTTFAIREKEEANDYRYFPEPDLPPLNLSEDCLTRIKNNLPALPQALYKKYQTEFGLNEYDAAQLTLEKEIADYFESVIQHTTNYKAAANWINGPIKQLVNEEGISLSAVPVSRLAEMIGIVDKGEVSFSNAASKLLPAILKNSAESIAALALQLNIIQTNNTDELQQWVNAVISKMPEKVAEYKKGKKGLIGLFVGEVKKLSKGKADLKTVTQLLEEALKLQGS
ncbi:Asp-tRNA(Asn)/Glu-tRNA(Gln) amidotransferase subunit GatB [Parafilimonas sp.]|uniref:Asp-tRNA(Asn)/Glu-tRNA(Gln) amidotransferase subunit GatB n=1 Tax=Parafilimonas sp. TaxID=1969739 RepID=UPI0039E24B78